MVVVVMHPCFFNSCATRVMEKVQTQKAMETRVSMKIEKYLGLEITMGFAIPGQVWCIPAEVPFPKKIAAV